MADTPMLELRDAARYFDVSRPLLQRVVAGEGKRLLRAVDGVSLAVPKGRTLSLVGESGCGKSTVARLAVGLYRPSAGQVVFDGRDLAEARAASDQRRRMQMIFQDPYASLNPRWRVGDIIAEPIRAFGLLPDRAAQEARVAELLTQVGLSPLDGHKFPHEFSGGQRQRISIARALSSNPEFLVCDEPTSALDVSVQAQILNLMKELQSRLGLTYLFISHNLAVVRQVSDQIGVMYLGRIAELAPAESLFSRPRHPYTRALMEAIPDLDMTGRVRIPVGGEVPSPITPPNGCAFHPRCPLAGPRCKAERPELKPAGDAMVACHAVEEGRDAA
ncbi:MAG: ATP-binding cassette domain-containing protein [Roseomonas sp.]|nr:ATP-binding cassette domain-containing protein [Roseomonas sp.]MCA3290985.1 ATP-binding cassette domain-containing protein [Roseomonas sp.]MCA3295089.1 ATP-binding cassette domain-containing protein [Roseomonas sp.]